MGVVRYALPLVPEDKELWAKNQARNEEQKRTKEEKKAKKARKARRAEASAKRSREAEKAGLCWRFLLTYLPRQHSPCKGRKACILLTYTY